MSFYKRREVSNLNLNFQLTRAVLFWRWDFRDFLCLLEE